jgi:DNA-binding CsgD family transcriptional regulator
LGTLLDTLRVGAFVTDRTGLIRYMTSGAERLLRDGGIFTVSGGRLEVRHAGLDGRFRKAIRDCADSVDDPRKTARCALRASYTLGSGIAPTIFISAISWTDKTSNARAAALVVVNELDELCDRAATWTSVLVELFDLTPAQSRVAAALCGGRSLSEHAASEGISILTARTLLKRVQEKTETHSQAELVRLLLRSSTLVSSR